MREFEERLTIRYACVGEARLQLAGTTTEAWGKVLNISLAGCMVTLPAASTLQSGDDVDLTIRVGDRSIRARAWVVLDAHNARRVGALFASMSAQTRLALNGLIAELEAVHPTV